jgi:hypothetical protein
LLRVHGRRRQAGWEATVALLNGVLGVSRHFEVVVERFWFGRRKKIVAAGGEV